GRFGSVQPAEGDALLAHAPALLADLLALLAREAFQELVEARVARVVPVELHAAAQHHARALALCGDVLRRKEDVQRGGFGALGESERPGEQELAVARIRGEKARSGDRREGQ